MILRIWPTMRRLSPFLRPEVVFLSILGFALGMFVALRPLLPVDETRYLDVAWEMWLSGDLFHLTRNGELYAHKPPLLFWLINLVWGVTGVNETAARLVGPAFALATAWATAQLGRHLWPQLEGIGGRAVLVLTGFSVFLIYASATMFDTMLALATVLGIGVIWRVGQGGGRLRHWIALGATIGLGVYAKGPVILVHLMPALLLMPFWSDRTPSPGAFAKGTVIAIGVALCLVGAWLLPALATGTDAYRAELLWTQTAGRVAGGFAHDRPVWFYLVLLPVLLFPWGWSLVIWRDIARLTRGDAASRMLVLWVLASFVLFSLISGKQAHYLLPEYPAMALLVARALHLRPGAAGRRHIGIAGVPLLLGVVAIAAASGLVPLGETLGALRPGAALAAVGALLIAAGFVCLRSAPERGGLVAGLGLAVAAHLLFAGTSLRSQFDGSVIAEVLAPKQGDGVAVYGMTYSAEFNFLARLTTPVAAISGATSLAEWASAHPGGILVGPDGAVPVNTPPDRRDRYNGVLLAIWHLGGQGLSVRE